MAFAGAAIALAPDYEYYFLILGRIKLKYVVALLVLLDLVGIADDINTGGHFAHLGGLVFGWFFVSRLREGQDLAEPVNRVLDKISGWFSFGSSRRTVPKRKSKAVIRATMGKTQHRTDDTDEFSFQEKLDAILDKIKQSGYESLSPEEKDFLYEASKK